MKPHGRHTLISIKVAANSGGGYCSVILIGAGRLSNKNVKAVM